MPTPPIVAEEEEGGMTWLEYIGLGVIVVALIALVHHEINVVRKWFAGPKK